MKRALSSVLAVLLLSTATSAQTRFPVSVTATGDDEVGKLVAYNLKEALARSALFVESSDTQDGISLVSLDIEETNGGASALSVQFSAWAHCEANGNEWLEKFTSHRVGIVGRQKAESYSKNLLASYSAFLDDVNKRHPQCKVK